MAESARIEAHAGDPRGRPDGQAIPHFYVAPWPNQRDRPCAACAELPGHPIHKRPPGRPA